MSKKNSFFFSILELGKCMWVLLFHLLLFFKFLKGEGFFLDEVFFLEKERGAWVYLFTIYLLNFFLFIFFCHIFYLLKGEGGTGFIFLLFCYFWYCVLSFCYHYLLLPGGGGVGFFSFYYFFFKKIFLVLFLVFERRKGA